MEEAGQHEITDLWRAGRGGNAPLGEPAKAQKARMHVAARHQHAIFRRIFLDQSPEFLLAFGGRLFQVNIDARLGKLLEDGTQRGNGTTLPAKGIRLPAVRREVIASIKAA